MGAEAEADCAECNGLRLTPPPHLPGMSSRIQGHRTLSFLLLAFHYVVHSRTSRGRTELGIWAQRRIVLHIVVCY